jgi:hypothetical protein
MTPQNQHALIQNISLNTMDWFVQKSLKITRKSNHQPLETKTINRKTNTHKKISSLNPRTLQNYKYLTYGRPFNPHISKRFSTTGRNQQSLAF